MTVLKVQQADRALVQKLGFEKTEGHHLTLELTVCVLCVY